MRFWNIPTIGIFWILLTCFFIRFFMLGQAIYGDGIYYWSYLRSVVIDHDIDLRNEASHSFSPNGNNARFEPEPEPKQRSLVENKYYPIGSSLFWAPAFLIAHTCSTIFAYPPNGYADQYQIAVGVLNVFAIVVGLVIIFRMLNKTYSEFISWLTILSLLFATNLFYYGSVDILNSHPWSFLISCIVLINLFKSTKKVSIKSTFFSGFLVGLLALIRPQDILFTILFVPLFVTSRQRINKTLIFMFIGGGTVGYLPQLLSSLALFGNITALPYLTSESSFHIAQSHIFDLFFSPTQGLLFYCPMYLVGIGGLIFYLKRKRPFGKHFLILLIVELFLISIWSGWAQGEAFGLRMIISLLPIFAFGIAEVFKVLSYRVSKTFLIVTVLLFIFQNFLMVFLFHLFLHNPTFINGELSNGGMIREEIITRLRSLN